MPDEARAGQGAGPVGPRVLLVDDEERFLATMAKLMRKKGLDVRVAESGLKALEEMARDEPDVVVLDVKMPGMDGLTALGLIKTRHPLIEVIILTGHAAVESAMEGIKGGAFDFLIKPCGLEELLEKVQEAWERRKIRRRP